MSIADLARKASKLAIDHSPTILTSIGVVGAITTAYLAGKASFQAARMIDAHEYENGTPDEPRELVKDRVRLVWRLYIPPAAMLVATTACIIGANKVGARRAAGLAAATTIIEKSAEEYRAKVAEKFGERKEEQVRDEINQDRIDTTYNDDVPMSGIADLEVCYDKFGGQYFRSSVEGINAAVNALNNAINHDGSASLADLYRLLEMDVPAFSESIGWTHDRLIEVRTGAALAHASKPIIVMEFRHDPEPNYGRFH